MSAEQRQVTVATTDAQEADLVVRLDTSLPPTLPVDRATAIFCLGSCFHRHATVERLDLLVDGALHRPAAWGMPRLELFQMMHPGMDLSQGGARTHDPASRDDPELRCYRSGFWATIPIPARARPGTIQLAVAVRIAGGAELVAELGEIDVVEARLSPRDSEASKEGGAGSIAICMATFNPDMTLFRRQIDSLRAQTDGDWVCLISDDCSAQGRFDEMLALVSEDSRFTVSRSAENLGPYRNFERALEMVPAEPRLVALCDQDDRWYPEKLETLRSALGPAQLVYSDQRLVDEQGRVLRDTLWQRRRNNHTNLASLLVANSITGAAALFRREVAERARPFPDTPGWQFHDHWIGLVAMAMGDVAYVDRPLYDYVQHRGAVVGQVAAEHRPPTRLGRVRRSLRGWRAAYFYGYLAREVLAQALLGRCSDTIAASKRRALQRFIAAQRVPLAFVWLAARPLRGLLGANETLGTEAELARGILWRHLIEARSGRRRLPFGAPREAACPPLDVDTMGQGRLARWRAQG